MKFRNTVYCTILLFLCSIGENVELLVHGNTGNLTDNIHGFPGHNIDLADLMQMFLSQTVEIENLKQQTENLKNQSENDRSTIQLLLNQTKEFGNFKRQAENDRSTIQSLQNRVFFLEAELKNVSQRLNDAVKALDDLKRKDISTTQQLFNQSVEIKQQSAKDSYTIHLLQNETQRLVRNLDDLKVQVRYTSLSLLDVLSMTEELNGSLIQRLEERISDVHDHITNVSKRIGFTSSVSSSNNNWNSGTLVFPEVITNVGNGYNPSTGLFTAPTSGEYVFFVNVQGYGTQTIYVDIVLNGVSQIRTLACGGTYQANNPGPNLALLTLQKEDRVWVKHHHGQGYFSDGNITTFSGFLL
ncbi:uncharacterized protein LOC128185980 [Crassostrea angulata]|uniref:uncharacterized protein LOC128185980 n=1 Tax=Magallana angulata TaxID=2784310 RepID=UPI0022B1F3E2|nr:uncharacterized protein LOC128185980 [Crassostrea angulata]